MVMVAAEQQSVWQWLSNGVAPSAFIRLNIKEHVCSRYDPTQWDMLEIQVNDGKVFKPLENLNPKISKKASIPDEICCYLL